jgi:thiosulfate/3-mercaptopyruvate sulfurtransferase
MEKKLLFFLAMFVLIASLFLVGSAQAWHHPPCAQKIDPIVSTDWLAENAGTVNLVILDIRTEGEYLASHIPGSVNEPFPDPFSTRWVVSNFDGLWLELPEKEDLFNTIGDLGITRKSLVVIVTTQSPAPFQPYGLANATRVALTLIYAGVKNVAILDGGYPKWVAEDRMTTMAVPSVEPITYDGNVNKAMFVSTVYVKKSIRKADILDARDADVYYGATIEAFAPEAGHIPSAKCLPAPWIWELRTAEEGGTPYTYPYYTYKDTELLGELARSVIREPWDWKRHLRQEIIVYCGVGGYASSWWFVLTQVLGYQNVKFYDGAAQEWVMKNNKMVPYQWD